jgi:hypothetical protein
MLQDARVAARKAAWRLAQPMRRIRRLSDLPMHATFVAISYSTELLAQTQLYPFHLHARQIDRRYGARLSEIDADDFARTRGAQRHPGVRWVALQTWFDLSDDQLLERVDAIRDTFPRAELIFLDFFAPLDLRYARALAPFVKTYVKKQVFRDLGRYVTTTLGDTNLTDYYGKRYGIAMPTTRHEMPPGFARRLALGANFCVSPQMLDRFRGSLPRDPRPIDVHARIATKGVEWYRRMREEARDVALGLAGVATVSAGRVPASKFLAELRRSKICFSPFGYGEVCWRDYEAILSGSLLLKPRMDHVRLTPAIFVADETYVPLEWDYCDYADKVGYYLANEKARAEIANNAFEVLRRYIRSDAVIDEMEPLFGGIDRANVPH